MDTITPYIPALIIFIGALFAASQANNDKKEIASKQEEINIIVKRNETLSSNILDLTNQLSRITKEVKHISLENSEISKVNFDLSKENIDLSKEIKDISDNIKDLSNENLKNTEEIKDYSNSEKFFRERDFSFLNKLFPDGCIINRQNFSGKNFSKSTISNSPIIEDIQSHIKVAKGYSELVNTYESKLNNGGVISSVEMNTSINLSYYGKLQKLQGHRIGNSCQYFVIIDVDEYGYTFAVGRTICGKGVRF
ncbi:hypothetical protein VP395_13660 [Mariniflexile soesokkakense]|uniref:Uncharacterized protein n=1 Tax=Mariniflexile soesokkakense TaxID=1343160 RepID=A0ABV0AFR5_9FLAO